LLVEEVNYLKAVMFLATATLSHTIDGNEDHVVIIHDSNLEKLSNS